MKTYEEGIVKGFSHNVEVVEKLEHELDNANSKIKELANRILEALAMMEKCTEKNVNHITYKGKEYCMASFDVGGLVEIIEDILKGRDK